MSTWNYRIIHEYHEKYDTHTYHIYEVYYDDDGTIQTWTESPVEPFGETPSELLDDLKSFMRAFERPILTEKTENGKLILVPDEESSKIDEIGDNPPQSQR